MTDINRFHNRSPIILLEDTRFVAISRDVEYSSIYDDLVIQEIDFHECYYSGALSIDSTNEELQKRLILYRYNFNSRDLRIDSLCDAVDYLLNKTFNKHRVGPRRMGNNFILVLDNSNPEVIQIRILPPGFFASDQYRRRRYSVLGGLLTVGIVPCTILYIAWNAKLRRGDLADDLVDEEFANRAYIFLRGALRARRPVKLCRFRRSLRY